MSRQTPKDKQVNFRVQPEVHQIMEKGAQDAGLSLAAWLTTLALTATGHSKLVEQLRRIEARKKAP